jgi:hypothetical protein
MDQSMEDFFRKPVVMFSGTFTATDTVSTVSSRFVPSALLNLYPAYTTKLKGWYSFKADMVFTIQVNANRFQAGRYILYAVPLFGMEPTSTSAAATILASRFSLTQRTQLPHVEIDLNCDTEATLRIPFVSCETGFSLQNVFTGGGIGDLASIGVCPYVPLITTAGSNTVPYTVWAHFENVELSGQTIYQSGEWKPNMKGKQLSLQTKEREQNGLGPISSVTTKVSTTLGILNKIPMLSAFTVPARWFTDIVTDAVKIWGFSKPLNVAPAPYMQRIIANNFANVDGSTNALPTALTTTQELELLEGFSGTGEDELSFLSIVGRPAYFTSFVWNTSDAAGSLVKSLNVSPTAAITTVVDSAVTTYNYTPLAYVANFFGHWRGSITYRFKIVKTEFHSGRLMIVLIHVIIEQGLPALLL